MSGRREVVLSNLAVAAVTALALWLVRDDGGSEPVTAAEPTAETIPVDRPDWEPGLLPPLDLIRPYLPPDSNGESFVLRIPNFVNTALVYRQDFIDRALALPDGQSIRLTERLVLFATPVQGRRPTVILCDIETGDHYAFDASGTQIGERVLYPESRKTLDTQVTLGEFPALVVQVADAMSHERGADGQTEESQQ